VKEEAPGISGAAEQGAIRSGAVGRMAALGGAGARVGINYLKHYGRAMVGAKDEPSRRKLREQLDEKNAEAVYGTFSKLKGGPLKLAQMLSIDKNLLPAAYARQFAQAHSSVPPLSYPLVVQTFRREFGKAPDELFDHFEKKASHGASIGQVHRAGRKGHGFAVKVQYPGVARSLKSDLAIVKPIALRILGLREADVESYFREVEARLLEETNYRHELERSMELAAASSHLAGVRFPGYHPEFSTGRILTSDWVDGMPLDRFAEGEASQRERDRIGQALWDFYSHQVHGLMLFHADPHPGNFLVKDGELWVLDFGCTKRISGDFYRKQFRFLDPRMERDPALLQEALRGLDVILPSDSPVEISTITALCTAWLELLARPFRTGTFDFGDPEFLQAIYDLGEENRRADHLRTMRGQRGSPDTVYVNRTFFGLYSLLGRLRARVEIHLPDWLHQENGSARNAAPRP
jgi:predicted unusual protein kinase regulating ubiquinone biosynthesis (AarF/ABC1/UbiB family)